MNICSTSKPSPKQPCPSRVYVLLLVQSMGAAMQTHAQAQACSDDCTELLALFVCTCHPLLQSIGAAMGPTVTGYLAANNRFDWAFYLAGGIKALYDLLLLWSFQAHKAEHERT